MRLYVSVYRASGILEQQVHRTLVAVGSWLATEICAKL